MCIVIFTITSSKLIFTSDLHINLFYKSNSEKTQASVRIDPVIIFSHQLETGLNILDPNNKLCLWSVTWRHFFMYNTECTSLTLQIYMAVNGLHCSHCLVSLHISLVSYHEAARGGVESALQDIRPNSYIRDL